MRPWKVGFSLLFALPFARAAEAGLRHTILPEVVLERRLHTQNNGLRERASRSQYLEVIRQAMERRRAAEAAQAEDT